MRNYEYLQLKLLTGGNLASVVNYEHKDRATQKRDDCTKLHKTYLILIFWGFSAAVNLPISLCKFVWCITKNLYSRKKTKLNLQVVLFKVSSRVIKSDSVFLVIRGMVYMLFLSLLTITGLPTKHETLMMIIVFFSEDLNVEFGFRSSKWFFIGVINKLQYCRLWSLFLCE